ncbi:MAG: cobyrinate a,c-diamide synthase [Firmicutes bacterium]|nr:cobyrinate a,c-diamide synthase [Bacillota bacterium]
MQRPRLVIAGVSSGVGKTTITLALMAALTKRAMTVQGFKVGPDYIDPSYHSAVTGQPSRNLDSWMMPFDRMCEIFDRASAAADLSLIEGVMGFYDGKDPLQNTGSTAHVSTLLAAPVILIVDVSSMARSAAAIVLGFLQLDPNVQVAGVIVNRVGSRGHYEMVKAAIEQVCGIPVVGYLLANSGLSIPERHLGLIPALERGELHGLFDQLAAAAEATFDLDRIIAIAEAAKDWKAVEPRLFAGQKAAPRATIAVAKDSAFNFYYPENIELLEWYGARITYFSPLHGESIPDDADGLYIGGGFPEEFAEALSVNRQVMDSFRSRIEAGLPTFAECGGFMYLCRSLTARSGVRYPMVGVIPADVAMQDRLAALGYREARALRASLFLNEGDVMRGHEFHYSVTQYESQDLSHAYEVSGMRGTRQEGYATPTLLAGYTHLHFASRPEALSKWLDLCAKQEIGSPTA